MFSFGKENENAGGTILSSTPQRRPLSAVKLSGLNSGAKRVPRSGMKDTGLAAVALRPASSPPQKMKPTTMSTMSTGLFSSPEPKDVLTVCTPTRLSVRDTMKSPATAGRSPANTFRTAVRTTPTTKPCSANKAATPTQTQTQTQKVDSAQRTKPGKLDLKVENTAIPGPLPLSVSTMQPSALASAPSNKVSTTMNRQPLVRSAVPLKAQVHTQGATNAHLQKASSATSTAAFGMKRATSTAKPSKTTIVGKSKQPVPAAVRSKTAPGATSASSAQPTAARKPSTAGASTTTTKRPTVTISSGQHSATSVARKPAIPRVNIAKASPVKFSAQPVHTVTNVAVSDASIIDDLSLPSVADSIENIIPLIAPRPMPPPLRRTPSDCLMDGPGDMYMDEFSDVGGLGATGFSCDVSTVDPEGSYDFSVTEIDSSALIREELPRMDLSALTVDEADNTLKTLSISNSFTIRDSVSLTSMNNLSVASMPSNWAELHMSSASFHTDNTVDLAMICCDSSDCAVDENDTYENSTGCINDDLREEDCVFVVDNSENQQNDLYQSTASMGSCNTSDSTLAYIEWRIADSSLDLGAPISRTVSGDPIADVLDGRVSDDGDELDGNNDDYLNISRGERKIFQPIFTA